MFKRRPLPETLAVPWGILDALVLVVSWFALQYLLGFFIQVLAPVIPAVGAFLVGARGDEIGPIFVLDAVSILLGFGLVALFLHRYKAKWTAVGWRKFSVLRALGYLVGILVAFFLLVQAVFVVVKLIFPHFDANQAQSNDIISSIDTHRSLALIALVILPPIFEETIFRGFLFPALSKRTGVIWGAVLSSAIFGLAHGQPNLFVYTFPLGLLLCFMYYKLGSIVPGIGLHMLNNYLAFLALSHK